MNKLTVICDICKRECNGVMGANWVRFLYAVGAQGSNVADICRPCIKSGITVESLLKRLS